MRNLSEEKRIIQKLAGKRSLRGANLDRLQTFLSSLELDDSPVMKNSGAALERIRADIHREMRILKYGKQSAHRKLSLKPVLAFCFIVIAFLAYIINTQYEPVKEHHAVELVKADLVVNGNANIMRGLNTLSASNFDVLMAGDRLVVRENSSAEILIGRNIRVYVPSSSEVTWKQGLNNMEFYLASGCAAVKLDKLMSGESFEVTTPLTRGRVRGTSFAVRTNNDGTARYEVYEGKVQVVSRIPENISLDEKNRNEIERIFEDNAVDIYPSMECSSSLSHAKLKRLLSKPGSIKRFETAGLLVSRKIKPSDYQLASILQMKGLTEIAKEKSDDYSLPFNPDDIPPVQKKCF